MSMKSFHGHLKKKKKTFQQQHIFPTLQPREQKHTHRERKQRKTFNIRFIFKRFFYVSHLFNQQFRFVAFFFFHINFQPRRAREREKEINEIFINGLTINFFIAQRQPLHSHSHSILFQFIYVHGQQFFASFSKSLISINDINRIHQMINKYNNVSE